MRNWKKVISMGLALTMALSLTACGSSGSDSKSDSKTTKSDTEKTTSSKDSKSSKSDSKSDSSDVPTIDKIELGKDYEDIEASIKILTNRTDIVDTVYKEYANEFMKLYPNIKVSYEGITDYEESLNLRLTTGDWGDICFIPTSVDKDELSQYFISLGDAETLDEIYNFCVTSQYDGQQYGLANGGTASGIVYNKRVWDEAGIKETPSTPDEFLDDLKQIQDKTDAIPLYTNFAASWPMGAWDAYIGITATGDADFMNNTICHMKDPFAKRDDMTGPYAVYYTLYSAVEQKLIEDDPASTDWESSKGKMNSGEIATMVLGSWAVNQCKDAGSTPDDVKYMPFPITVDGKRYAGTGGNYSYGINKKSSADNQIASMVYVKWLLEESPIFEDEGSIPALKSADLPEVLSDFEGVELLSDNPAKAGEETLFNDLNSESEVGINNDDYPDAQILEAALYGTSTLDDIMDEWNQKWSNAQEKLGVEVDE